MTDQPNLKELQNEYSTLDRVSHRLAMTDAGAPLEKVLSLLLPRLLSRIGKNDDAKRENRRGGNKRKLIADFNNSGDNEEGMSEKLDDMYETIHKKLIEMLMHTMKRVRDDRECKLPCEAILELLTSKKDTVNAFTVNLSLTFLTLGMNRCTPVECSTLLPELLEFLESLVTSNQTNSQGNGSAAVSLDSLIDPSRKMRHAQTYHLILRCLEKLSHNPLESAAARRAMKSESSDGVTSSTTVHVSSLAKTKELLLSRPIIAAALYDLFLDVFLYAPVSVSSSLIPNGMSTFGYQMLIGGAASEETPGCKSWREEFATRTKLRELKLKFLDLVAPCRRFAIFLQDEVAPEDKTVTNFEGLGMSRTVALMVLLSGDVDIDVRSKADSYLKAHIDAYRGKEISADSDSPPFDEGSFNKLNDPLYGDQVALANTLLAQVIGGFSSNTVTKEVLAEYKSETATAVAETRLGLIYTSSNDSQERTMLSCCRMKLADSATAPAVKFVSKMLDDNPKLFHVMDMAHEEADIAAVCIGSLAVTIFGDLWKPGSSGSSAVEAAASLLNALCLRLTFFYEMREHEWSIRLETLLAKSMSLACSVLAPTSSGESTSLSSNGTRAATIQIEIRDKMYGVVCTLSRSKRFSLHERYSLFNCGISDEKRTFTSISTAKLLFGCTMNEVEVLRPRATSSLDALLSSYTRVVNNRMEKLKQAEVEAVEASPSNPWAIGASSTLESYLSPQQSKKKDFNSHELSQSLLPLLWSAARRGQTKSSRLSAARWSQELLIHLDSVSAYHLLCFLSGDDDPSVSMVSKKALGIESTIGEDVSLAYHNQDVKADFSELTAIIVGREKISSRPTYINFHIRAQAASLRFLFQLLLDENSFYADENLGEYVLVILNTLESYRNRPLTRDEAGLMDECSICLAGCLSSSQDARRVVKTHGFEGIADQALRSSSSKARRNFADVMRSLYEDKSLWCNENGFSASAWISQSGLLESARACREKLDTMFQASYVLGEVHGASFLGASCVRAFRLAAFDTPNEPDSSLIESWSICGSVVSLLGKGLSHSELVIGNACARGLITAFGYSGQDAPILDTRLFEPVAVAMSGLVESLKRFSSIDHADTTRLSSLINAAGILLAATTSGAGHRNVVSKIDLGPARLQCIDSLFAIVGSVVHKKDEELSLSVGEALVKYADGIGTGKWSSVTESLLDNGQYDETIAHSLPPHKHILYTIFNREMKSTNPVKKTGSAALLLALAGHSSRLALLDSSFISRTMVKEVIGNLERIQETFIQLLRDPKSKQLARECCCRGLAACRGLSLAQVQVNETSDTISETLNDSLLKAFGQTSNFGQSAMMESREQAQERRSQESGNSTDLSQTEVGGTAGMGESVLGAYREMASASVAVNRPDVLYTLMILSTNHPVWVNPDVGHIYSAKSLLGHAEGLEDNQIRHALKPHLGRLIPSLLRACNDPNKQTREQMNALWVGLTGGGSEARESITRHFIPTLDTLIKDASSKLWRVRAGACGALSDIIVGRSWEDLGGGDVEEDEGDAVSFGAAIRILRLWRCAVRALDDVRTPVRDRGESMGRGLRALTIRLCDPSASNITQEQETYLSNDQREQFKKQREVNAEKAATVSLKWLVKVGLNQPCAEATGLVVSCLLGIVDIAKATTLEPVLDSLIGALLMAMSGLEPAALNYLQVRAAGNDQGSSNENYDRLESARVRLAMSGPIHQALQKCLDMVKHIDLESQKKIVPELDSALRMGAGFATRAAVADTVSNLCNTCPNAFKFPGTSTANPSVRLLRALYYASERERGASSKDRMTHAMGSLAELVPGKATRTLAAKACERYSESSGSSNDPSVRKAAAATVRAIVVRAAGQMHDGGRKDVWAKVVLPTAFLGRHDTDEKVKGLWNEVWEEGGAAIRSRDKSFGVLPQEQILPFIKHSVIQNLQSTSWANRLSACAVIKELTEANVLAPTPCSINNVLDKSNERQSIRASVSSSILSECVNLIAQGRIWNGKGEVVKSAASIAGKWTNAVLGQSDSGSAPLVFNLDTQDDLFAGDYWFNKIPDTKAETDEDCNLEEETEAVDEINTSESALETDEANFEEEEDNDQNNDTNETETTKSLTFIGFCRLLCDQGLRESSEYVEGVLPYKSAALSSLSNFLSTVVVDRNSEVAGCQRLVYNLIAPRLHAFVLNSQTGTSVPPLLVAKSLECLASAIYDGMGDDNSPDYSNALTMLKLFAECGGEKQGAWSVRRSGVLAASSLVSKMSSNALCKNESIAVMLNCSSHAVKDRKFWKVRQAGLELLLSLVIRVGKQRSGEDNEFESVLPYKEKIQDVARKSLSDNESQVTATASQITIAISSWP